MMFPSRLSTLTDSLKASSIEALALNPGPSLIYLTGLEFHLMERPVVAFFTVDSVPVLVLPELEMLKVSQLPFEVKTFAYGEDPEEWDKSFREAGRWLGLEGKSIGVEPLSMRVMEYEKVKLIAGNSKCPDASMIIGDLRTKKGAEEISNMRKAVHVAQDALEAVLPDIKIGMTELEIAGELVVQLLRHGSQPELPFAPIVSGGPNGANPHAVPSGRILQPGDLLVVDWGARVDGYISDLTRTYAVGEIDEEYRQIHQIVLEANEAGRVAASPAVPCANVDIAARSVIQEAGFGEFFTHRTGHGIGMEAHENPYIRGDNLQLLEPGMAFTVEPGIYLPGRNGVRIEDNLVITEHGAECLSDMPRQLRKIG
jgi:Xaa-Pro dipeptidase